MAEGAALGRARGVLGLYRGAQGGERQAAAGALRRLLSVQGLYLDDLEAGLPHSQDPADLDGWRPTLALLARLGTDEQDEALERLIESDDLTPAERRLVLEHLSLPALVSARAAGWLQLAADPELDEATLVRAGEGLRPGEVEEDARPLAESVRQLSLQSAWLLARPERRLRAQSEAQAEFLAGVIEGLTGRRARLQPDPAASEPGGYVVLARLSAGELSRARSASAQQAGLERELLRAARQFGRRQGEGFR